MPDVITRDNVAQSLGPANANATAQQTGAGIGIQNIRRGVARAAIGPDLTNMAVSATTYAALTPPLGLTVWLSGRPIRVTLTAMVSAGASANVTLDVLMRGVSITAADNGLIHSNSGDALTLHGEEIVMAPPAGSASFSVVAQRVTADGALYLDNQRAILTVVEL